MHTEVDDGRNDGELITHFVAAATPMLLNSMSTSVIKFVTIFTLPGYHTSLGLHLPKRRSRVLHRGDPAQPRAKAMQEPVQSLKRGCTSLTKSKLDYNTPVGGELI